MGSQNLDDIKEIKTTTKFILKRLNILKGCGETCTCVSELEELRKDVQAVAERINALELSTIDLQSEETDEQRFNQIQTNIYESRQSLLALQTDDSGLKVYLQTNDSNLKEEELPPSANASATSASTSSGASASHIHEYPGGATNGAVFHVGESANNPLNITEKHTRNETKDSKQPAHRTSSADTNVPRIHMATSLTSHTDIPDTYVIRQTQQDFVGGGDYWKFLAQQQLSEAQRITRDEESIRTVLCLDISESMASGNAWSQAKIFVNDFLNALDMLLAQFGPIGLKAEYIAVATFGLETKQQQQATTNYTAIRDKIDHLQLGGPSPLFGGLWFSLAGAMCCRATATTQGGIILTPRIIVITDGKPTETGLKGGPDRPTKNDETLMAILGCLEEIQDRGTSVFFVGVGDYDEDFLKLVTASEGRKKLFGYQDGRRLAKRTYLCTKTTLFDDSLFLRSSSGLSVEDEEDMQDIRADSVARLSSREDLKSKAYAESKNEAFPVIGSRVRRGPDWQWDTQDHNGVGTVVGHSDEVFQVWVTWDFDNTTASYRYGLGEYDLLVTDEPRELKHGETIAIGCRVKPGRDARSQELSSSTQGVVIRMSSKKANVRWDNGKRGDYSYGAGGRYEIELCTSQGQNSDLNQSSNTSAWGTTTPGYSKRSTKNKNKNTST